jgi:hypothetical protein
MSNSVIETERHGLWAAAAFVLALLGVVLGLVAIKRVHEVAVGSQIEVLVLAKKVKQLEQAQAAAPTAPAVEAAPAAEAAE